MEKIPMTVHRDPGTTRFVRYRSAEMRTWRGSSPTGTWSGASWSLMTCWSTNLDFSWRTMYGSSGHLGVGSFGTRVRPHCLGRDTPVKPPRTGTPFSWAQFRHWITSSVALEDITDAQMTMPGTRTRLEMVSESKFRMETSSAVECRRSWCGGRSILASWGKTIRRVQFRRAFSNYQTAMRTLVTIWR